MRYRLTLINISENIENIFFRFFFSFISRLTRSHRDQMQNSMNSYPFIFCNNVNSKNARFTQYDLPRNRDN